MEFADDPNFTVKVELERKTVEELKRLAAEHVNGHISDAALSQALHTLWRCTSGLLREDLNLVIHKMTERYPISNDPVIRFLFNADRSQTVIMIWKPGSSKVIQRVKTGTNLSDRVQEFGDVVGAAKMARDFFDNVIKRLKAADFKEIE